MTAELSRGSNGHVTTVELDALSRPDRIRAMWGMMSVAARERAWAGLDGDRRVDVLAAIFDATEEQLER